MPLPSMMMSQFVVGGGSGRISIGNCGGSNVDDFRSTVVLVVSSSLVLLLLVLCYCSQNQHQL